MLIIEPIKSPTGCATTFGAEFKIGLARGDAGRRRLIIEPIKSPQSLKIKCHGYR